ncbi:MAG: glutamate-1-semialdehyde 2,1-aminomutase [Kiritimatiellia bacterium]|nr:glutamate-1-semialdehyde 2,1-aminomutase [Kiritimatiellia bacterium]
MVELNSQALFDRAKRVMPGGVNSPVRACTAVGRIPRFISRADGDRIVDVDGNEYIDYVCSWGPGILGHAHPKVLEAVKKACDEGLTYGAPTAREVEMAELIRELVPSMEVSRMVSSGTEAVMSAVRVARGFTGRDDILKFEGCYHGHSDGLLVKAGSGLLTGSVPTSAGVPEDYAQHTIVVPYNDIEAVRQVFAERGQTLAAVVVEPVAANMGVVLPKPGFLEFLREITLKYGTLLIFDEVITGFRLGLSGAQTPGSVPKTSGSVPKTPGSVPKTSVPKTSGSVPKTSTSLKCSNNSPVIPDLTTLGKIVGGGMPAAVYGGREEVMRQVAPDGKVYQAGTLSGNPIATAAGLATLKLLKSDPDIYARLEAKTRRLAETIRTASKGRTVVTQIASLMSVDFPQDLALSKPQTNQILKNSSHSPDLRFAAWYNHLLSHGVYVAPSRFEAMFVSDAHTDEDIARTCEVAASFFAVG